MSFRIIALTKPISVTDYTSAPSMPLLLNGRLFEPIALDVNPIFYDFLVTPDGLAQAIQLQVGRDDPLCRTLGLAALADSVGVVQFSPCFRVWLSDERNATEAGVEAFGDLIIAQASDGTVLIGVSLDWLAKKGLVQRNLRLNTGSNARL
jgi:hypothetical protein